MTGWAHLGPLYVEIADYDDHPGENDHAYGCVMDIGTSHIATCCVRFGQIEVRFPGMDRDDAINQAQITLRRIADDLEAWRS